MTCTVRFAPSPTGLLHIGNSRTALLNWLFAKTQANGRFVLRLDDTDLERSKPEFADAIVEDLLWLGLIPDVTVAQSQRLALYDAAADRLRASGRLYPCYETADELERKRKRQLARGLPPIYDRAALKLSETEHAALVAEGRTPHWRFQLEPSDMQFTDLVRGEVHVDAASLSDPVLIRGDGSYLYTLPSVVDDIDLGITHVIRGEDHVFNTGVQMQIFLALGAKPPVFGHHNLLTTASGEGLSKRTGALSLRSLREAGLEPMSVANLAVLIGSSEAVEAYNDLDTLGQHADLAHISRAPARFDPQDLETLNARLLHATLFCAVQARLHALYPQANEAFWLAVRGNLTRFADVAVWVDVVAGVIPAPLMSAEDMDFVRGSAAFLPAAPWDETSWGHWTKAVQQATGRKGKALFMPLRQALTGLEHGPELKMLLPLMTPDLVRSRLRVS